MTGHPDFDVLADLAEGAVLPPADEAGVREHVASCPDCAETVAALGEVRDLLGEVAAEPCPMPDDVAARIDDALADAARGRVPVVPPPRPHTAPVVPPRPAAGPRRRARRPFLLAAAAVTAVALGAGVLVARLNDEERSAGGHTAAAPASHEADAAAPGAAAPPAPRAPARYTAAGLTDQVRELLRARAVTLTPDSPRTALAAPQEATSAEVAPPCVASALGGLGVTYGTARAVDVGTYEGDQAYVLVWDTGTPGRVRVVVVAQACPDARAGRVLADTTLVV